MFMHGTRKGPMEGIDLSYLKLSVQRGLLGNVTANLGAFHASLTERKIHVTAYFFGSTRQLDLECIEDCLTQIIADFPDGYTISSRIEFEKTPLPLGGAWCFVHAEWQVR
jgi:hypothetical protein